VIQEKEEITEKVELKREMASEKRDAVASPRNEYTLNAWDEEQGPPLLTGGSTEGRAETSINPTQVGGVVRKGKKATEAGEEWESKKKKG